MFKDVINPAFRSGSRGLATKEFGTMPPVHILANLQRLYWVNDDPFQTHRQHIWAFQSWPLPLNFLAPSDALYVLTIVHVGTQYVPV